MKFIYTDVNGNLCVVHPAAKEDLEKILGPLTDDQYKQHVIERSVPAGVTVTEVSDDVIPASRLFRNAWKQSGKKLKVDVPKAKELHMARIRKMRDKALQDEDVKMLRNFANNDELTKIEAHKQKLRDLPATFSLDNIDLNNPKECWPEDLELPEEYK